MEEDISVKKSKDGHPKSEDSSQIVRRAFGSTQERIARRSLLRDQPASDCVGTPLTSKVFRLPFLRTPPSNVQNTSVRNPFEDSLRSNLDRSIVSPTLFIISERQKDNAETFSWDIDHVAKLHPAPIDEQQIQLEDPVDPEIEHQIQEKIDRYFQHVDDLDSPWNSTEASRKRLPVVEEIDKTPVKYGSAVSLPDEKEFINPPDLADVWTQTELSLPATTSELLETAINKYCSTYMEKCVENTRTNLFSPTVSSPSCSFHTPKMNKLRTFGTPMKLLADMPSPIDISPIVSDTPTRKRYHKSPSYWHSYSDEISEDGASTWAHTTLSLAETVPKHMENLLKLYFTFTQDQSGAREISINNSFIKRRKLFHHDSANTSASTIPSPSISS